MGVGKNVARLESGSESQLVMNDNINTAALGNFAKMSDRAAPLSRDQRIMLLRLVGERRVLQDCSTNPSLIYKKQMAWEDIKKEFTAINPDTQPRTAEQLKRCYHRIKLR